MDSKKLADAISELIFAKKGYDVKIIDLKEVTTLTDYFVICSADSDTQVKAIADEIDKTLRDEGIKSWHKEGYRALSWVLIDYVDVVVHVFRKDAREYYNLEKLWGDAPSYDAVDPLLKAVDKKKRKSPVRKTVKKVEKEIEIISVVEEPTKKSKKAPAKKVVKKLDVTVEKEAPLKKVRKTPVKKVAKKTGVENEVKAPAAKKAKTTPVKKAATKKGTRKTSEKAAE